MRKLLLVSVIVMTVLSFSSCVVEREFGRFFSDGWLAENHLSDMPVPKSLDGAVIEENRIFYINLNDAEYEQYVSDVLSYLRARDDIYYLSEPVSSALEAEIFPYDILAPIPEDYDTNASEHRFVFSTVNGLEGRSGDRLANPVRIQILRREYKIENFFKSYEYNTSIAVTNYNAGGQYDPCYREHTMDEGLSYIVPGSSKTVTVYSCKLCSATEFSDFIGDNKMYEITLADSSAKRYVSELPKNLPSGVIVSVNTTVIGHADIEITVNGLKIPKRDAGDRWCYEFIMPCEDIEIVAELVYGT